MCNGRGKKVSHVCGPSEESSVCGQRPLGAHTECRHSARAIQPLSAKRTFLRSKWIRRRLLFKATPRAEGPSPYHITCEMNVRPFDELREAELTAPGTRSSLNSSCAASLDAERKRERSNRAQSGLRTMVDLVEKECIIPNVRPNSKSARCHLPFPPARTCE